VPRHFGSERQHILSFTGTVIATWFPAKGIVIDRMGRQMPADSMETAREVVFGPWSYATPADTHNQ
jgi:hypothetical protein